MEGDIEASRPSSYPAEGGGRGLDARHSSAEAGSARLTSLLSILSHLLKEYEVKLALELLQDLAHSSSKLAGSFLSVSALEMDKSLLSFATAQRDELSGGALVGVKLIEDHCKHASRHAGRDDAMLALRVLTPATVRNQSGSEKLTSPPFANPKRASTVASSKSISCKADSVALAQAALALSEAKQAGAKRASVPSKKRRSDSSGVWRSGLDLDSGSGCDPSAGAAEAQRQAPPPAPPSAPVHFEAVVPAAPRAPPAALPCGDAAPEAPELREAPQQQAACPRQQAWRTSPADGETEVVEADLKNVDAEPPLPPHFAVGSPAKGPSPVLPSYKPVFGFGAAQDPSAKAIRETEDGEEDSFAKDLGAKDLGAKEAAGDQHSDDDCSSDSSEFGEVTQVTLSDDLEDLNVMQMTWLATPDDGFLLHPNMTARVCWDSLTLLLILLDCVLLPLKYCFRITTPHVWDMASTGFFGMDILLNFNTGYFHGSILILRRRFILKHYMRTWFAMDLLATCPWEAALPWLSDDFPGISLLRSARLLRLLRVVKITNLMERLQEVDSFTTQTFTVALSIVKMFFTFVLLCHWTACIFGFLGDPENLGHASASAAPHIWEDCVPGGPCEDGIIGTPWRHRYGLDNYDVWTQYLTALHFATGLVTGAELSLQPGFWVERIFVTLMMIVGLFTCAAVLSQVLVLFERMVEDDMAVQIQVRAMRRFMSTRKVPPTLQSKVRRFLEKSMQQPVGDDYEVLQLLSPLLQVELLVFLNRRAVIKHPFFQALPAEALHTICLQSSPTMYDPGDVVAEKGQLAMSMAVLTRGKLRVERAFKNKSVYLNPGSWIGDACLFVETRRTHTVSAVKNCEVLVIQKRMILQVSKDYPDMVPIFSAFKERVERGENISSCPVCGRMGHSESHCPQRRLLQDSQQRGFLRFRTRVKENLVDFGPRESEVPPLPTSGQLTVALERANHASAEGGGGVVIRRPSTLGTMGAGQRFGSVSQSSGPLTSLPMRS